MWQYAATTTAAVAAAAAAAVAAVVAAAVVAAVSWMSRLPVGRGGRRDLQLPVTFITGTLHDVCT